MLHPRGPEYLGMEREDSNKFSVDDTRGYRPGIELPKAGRYQQVLKADFTGSREGMKSRQDPGSKTSLRY